MTTRTHNLSNGLELIMNENHDLPVVSIQILVRAGSANETEKEAGIAHLIEHMMFKGTKRRPVGVVSAEIESVGGEVNAYTSLDQTVYYVNMASRFWEQGLDILTDAVLNSVFDEEELEREKEVVLEEIRRGKDDPDHFVTETLFGNLYGKHPYGRPIIGFDKTVKGFTRDNILEFCRKWYVPSNMSVVVVGDFNSKKLIELCNKIFPKNSKKAHQIKKTYGVKIAKKLEINSRPLSSAHISIGFPIPNILNADIPAIDVASFILGGQRTSRFEQEIKEKKNVVHRIYTYSMTPKFEGLLLTFASLQPEKLNLFLDLFVNEIQKLRNDGPDSSELERVKQNILADKIYEKETVGGLAGKYAYLRATAGRYDFEDEYHKIMLSLTVEDIKNVVDKYFKISNSSVSVLLPDTFKSPDNLFDKYFSGTKKTKKVNLSGNKAKLVEIDLKDGAKLLVLEDKRVPVVGFCATVKGGLRAENEFNNGISELTSRSLVKGTRRLNAMSLASEVEGMSATLSAFGGKNSFGVKGSFLSKHFDRFLPLMMEVLTEPAFETSEILKEKKYLLSAIDDEEDSLAYLAAVNTIKNLFPKHPYGLRTMGQKKSVSRLTANDVRVFYEKIFSRKDIVFSFAGDCKAEVIKELLDDYLLKLPSGKPFDKKFKVGNISSKRKFLIRKKGREQSHIVIGGRSVSLKSQDKYAMIVAEQILSGMGGRLFLELRDKLSLAYSVGMSTQLGVETGYYLLYIGTDPSKIDLAISGMNSELEKMMTGKISSEEIQRAKKYILGTYELSKQRNVSRASDYAVNLLYGIKPRELDLYPYKINNVEIDDVQRVVKKYLNPDDTITTIVTPK